MTCFFQLGANAGDSTKFEARGDVILVFVSDSGSLVPVILLGLFECSFHAFVGRLGFAGSLLRRLASWVCQCDGSEIIHEHVLLNCRCDVREG